MAKRNRYPDDQSYQDWEQHKMRYDRKNDFNRRNQNTGNTGYGFYDQNTGVNVGNSNAGYSGKIAHGREVESQGIYNGNFNSGNQYNTGNQNDYNNPNDYNRVNYFPDNDENRDYDERDYENNQYGTSGTYGYQGNTGYGNDYNRQDMNQGYKHQGYKSDFEKHYYQQQQGGHGNYADGYTDNRREPRSRYGGDERNYGNANQAGFDRDWWDRTRDTVASWFGDDDAERRRKMDRRNMGTGKYRGKGPKNYQRSEQRIREDICDRLTEDDLIDASDVEVQVQGTEVVLTGYVSSRDQKRRAEDIVESVGGVHNVENRIRVGQAQTDSNTGTTTV